MEPPIWLSDNPQRYGPLQGEARADVAVVGGGIAGLTAAYLLSSSGVGVAVIEAGKIGSGESGRGAAMGTVQQGLCFTRLVRLHGQGRAANIVKAYQAAVHLIAGIVAKEELRCGLSVQDSFVFTTDARRVGAVEREAELASRFGLDAGLTNIAPFLLPYRVAACVRGQITLNPAQYLAGLAGTIATQGGVIFEDSPVIEVGKGAVRTNSGRLRAKCVLIATGIPILQPPHYGSLRLLQGTGWAASVCGEPLPIGIWQNASDGFAFRAASDQLIVCSGDSGRAVLTKEAFLRNLARYLPDAKSVAWPIHSIHTLDGLPDIGRYKTDDGCLFVATGFGRWGLTCGTLAGDILCDLVLDKPNPMAELFSPQRLPSPIAIGGAFARGLAKGVKNVASSVRNQSFAL